MVPLPLPGTVINYKKREDILAPYLCGENRLVGFALCVILGHEDVDDTGRGYTGLMSRLSFEFGGQTHFIPNKLRHVFYLQGSK